MEAASFAPHSSARRRIPIAEIDATVAARLGATRGLGNSQPACFNRQVAMYLAKHVGGWSTKIIGRFYNGRDHSTVCCGIQRIQALRENDPVVDALVADLKRCLCLDRSSVATEDGREDVTSSMNLSLKEIDELADLIVQKLMVLLDPRSRDQPALPSTTLSNIISD